MHELKVQKRTNMWCNNNDCCSAQMNALSVLMLRAPERREHSSRAAVASNCRYRTSIYLFEFYYHYLINAL